MRLRCQGRSYREIGAALTQEGFIPKSGREWQPNTVRHIAIRAKEKGSDILGAFAPLIGNPHNPQACPRLNPAAERYGRQASRQSPVGIAAQSPGSEQPPYSRLGLCCVHAEIVGKLAKTLPMSGDGTVDCSAVSDPLPFRPIATRRVVYEPVVAPPGPALRGRGSHGQRARASQRDVRSDCWARWHPHLKPRRALRLVGRPWAYAWK